MVLDQHLVSDNKYFELFESLLPMLSIIAVVGTISGLIFTFYYLFIKFNVLFTILYFIAFMIGIVTGIFIEVTIRRIELVTKQNVKGI